MSNKLSYDQLKELAEDLYHHLEYIGWGDSWERECLEPINLMERAEKAFNKEEP